MKAGEFRSMSGVELDKTIDDLRRALFDRRQELITGELENVTLIQKARRDLARAMTIKQQKETAPAAK